MRGMKMFSILSVRNLARRTNKIRRDESGVTAVEFAIIGPILIGMFVSIVDLGLGLYNQVQLANAAQAAADYAMQKGYNSDAMTTVAQAATRLAGVTVANSQFCGCPSSSGVTTITCGSSCSDGLTAGTFARTTTTKDYSTLLQYPGLPATFHLSETSLARVQ